MSIEMPNEEEKKRSIHFIINNGVTQNKHLQARIPELIRTIGLRNLFWETWDCVFLALLGGITLGALFVIPSVMYQPLLPLALLLVSPAVYGLLHFLTIWKEKQVGLYEIKMTCHYTLKELTALRMVFFGGASALMDVIFVLCIRQQVQIVLSFFQMLGISLSALFLYGTATLFLLSHIKSIYQWILPAGWCLACIIPAIFHADILGILMKIPNAVAIVAALAAAVLFFAESEHYLSKSYKGGVYYAVN